MTSIIDIEAWQTEVSEAFESSKKDPSLPHPLLHDESEPNHKTTVVVDNDASALGKTTQSTLKNNNAVFDKDTREDGRDLLDHYFEADEDAIVGDEARKESNYPLSSAYFYHTSSDSSRRGSPSLAKVADDRLPDTCDDAVVAHIPQQGIFRLEMAHNTDEGASSRAPTMITSTARGELEHLPEAQLEVNEQITLSTPSSIYNIPRSMSLLSRTATKLKGILSAKETPTEGITENEALNIAKETYQGRDDVLKLFHTEGWFNSSSAETNTLTLKTEDQVTSARTLPISLLQSEPARNPFFREDNITAQALTRSALRKSAAAKSAPTDTAGTVAINWNQLETTDKTNSQRKRSNTGNLAVFEDPIRTRASCLPNIPSKRFWIQATKVSIGVLVLVLLIITIICLFFGTRFTTKNYFDKLEPSQRAQQLAALMDQYNISTTAYPVSSQTAAVTLIPTQVASNDKAEPLGHNIQRYNSPQLINPKFRKNNSMMQLMHQSRMHNVLYGVNYAPQNVMYPICGATLDEVILDVAVLSQVTTRLKLFGLQCQQAELTLEAIQTLGVNMTVTLGIWIGQSEHSNSSQFQDLEAVLKKYPINMIDSIMVGNEVLQNEEMSVSGLNRLIGSVKKTTNITVGTVEYTRDVHFLEDADITGLNMYPFLKGIDANTATSYVSDYLQTIDNKEHVYVAEIGWPSEGGSFRRAKATVENLQALVDTFVCAFNRRDIGYYWFEAFDEPWKRIYDEGSRRWESHWGLFDRDRKLKIRLPICV